MLASTSILLTASKTRHFSVEQRRRLTFNRKTGNYRGNVTENNWLRLRLRLKWAALLWDQSFLQLHSICDDVCNLNVSREREESIQNSYMEQSVLYKEERLKQLMKISKKIIAGKRKKQGGDNFDENAALQGEIDKIPQMPEDVMMVQLLTRPHWELSGEEIKNKTLTTMSTKDIVFHDLWERGYYLTCGEKFGGDFLVYPGDPLKFHSHYIAVCVDGDEPLTPQFLITKGRLGTNVKKIVLLCSVDCDGVVNYQNLEWATNILGIPSVTGNFLCVSGQTNSPFITSTCTEEE
uniref:tRNA-splicing endonuclease subunit SEN34 n=1 Tax=Evadne anonyx TaxID=141404 RepID=A0A9N6ZGU9_9CRUS|nr:EOG090X0G6M [Evadne anonyx]